MDHSNKNIETTQQSKCQKNLNKQIPIIVWLPQYTVKKLLHDLLAGFTVALTEIPQSIAYAGIAGLPLQYGLYSSFIGGFMYAIFGSCNTINMGSTSIMALLIQDHVAKKGVGASIFMSFVAGVIILFFGLMKLGFVIEFFSYPVMAGFTSAAALTIASSQLKNFFGLKGQANGFLGTWESVFQNVKDITLWDTVLGTASLVVLFMLKEISVFSTDRTRNIFVRKSIFLISIAKNTIVVIFGILLAYFLTSDSAEYFKLTGAVEGGIPTPTIPPFSRYNEMTHEYGISLIFIPLVAILETIAIGKVFSKDKPLDATQEMIALGVANLIGSFFMSMPVTGSFSRTAVNIASGAKTNMAAVFTGITILVALQFLTSTFYYIPKATLAAVIICAMFYLCDFKAPSLFWKNSKLDLVLFSITLLSSLCLSLEYGILIGIGTNLALVLYRVARPGYQLQKIEISHCQTYLIILPGTIHFPAVEHLKKCILTCEKSTSWIILEGSLVQRMDITVAKVLESLATDLVNRQQKLIFFNFSKQIQQLCIGVNENLINHFKSGKIKDVLDQERPSSPNEVYTIY